MVERHYHYRNHGQIGDPNSTPMEELELIVAKTGGDEGEVLLSIRGERFHGATVSLSSEQLEHLQGALEAYHDDEDTSDPTAVDREAVIHPDGSRDADFWEPL